MQLQVHLEYTLRVIFTLKRGPQREEITDESYKGCYMSVNNNKNVPYLPFEAKMHVEAGSHQHFLSLKW